MKNILLFLIFLLWSCLFCSFGQKNEKTITIDDIVYPKKPQSLQCLQWRKNTEQISYILGNDSLVVQEVDSDEKKFLLNTNDINQEFDKYYIKPCDGFPKFEWKDENSIQFLHYDSYFVYYYFICFDINTKKIESIIKYDMEAENINVSPTSFQLAYTVDNNLYIANKDSIKIAIRKDADNAIANGQFVYSGSFKISKGTFWSNSGKKLAYYRSDRQKLNDFSLLNIKAHQKIIDKRNYSVPASREIKYTTPGEFIEQVTIGVYDTETKHNLFLECNQHDLQYLTSVSWGNNDQFVYVGQLNYQQDTFRLNKYEAQTGKFVQTLFQETNKKYIDPEHSPFFFKEKDNEFLWLSERDGFNHIYHYTTNGQLLGQITKGDWVVTQIYGFDAKERNIFYTSTQESPLDRLMYKVNIKNKKITEITKNKGTHACLISDSRNYAIDNYSSISVPRKIDLLNLKTRKVKNILTAKNPYSDYLMSKPETFSTKAADDSTDIFCRVIKPPNFNPNKKYPLVVYVYGGPHIQMITNEWLTINIGVDAWMWMYYMAQKGFITMTIDNRGSENRGLKFENVIYGELGKVQMQDQVKAVKDYISKNKFVDQEKIGIHGGSFGGFMTISLLLDYPELFKVGVSRSPVTDWFYYNIEYSMRYMSTPEKNPEGYLNTSLLNTNKKLKRKLLLIHGAMDTNVLWDNSLYFLRSRIESGDLLDFFLFPLQNHSSSTFDKEFSKPYLMRLKSEYFENHLK